MNILLTGATSQQCNPASNKNIVNFTGLLRRSLHALGHEVYWADPSISWRGDDLATRFDHVIVGMAPVTSLSANRIYGALSIIGELMVHNPRKLSILLDAPEPDKIAAGNRAILAHPENLTKAFYSYRKEYVLATQQRARLLDIVKQLHTTTWPTTIVPTLPWHSPTLAARRLPFKSSRVVPLNLDRVLLDSLFAPPKRSRERLWVTEGDITTPTTIPTQAIPRKGLVSYDGAVMDLMSTSAGVLVEVPKSGTWWNTRYAQALTTNTPVFCDWRESSMLGPAWSSLPMNIEVEEPADWSQRASAQLTSYLDACPTYENLNQDISSIIKFSRVKSKV